LEVAAKRPSAYTGPVARSLKLGAQALALLAVGGLLALLIWKVSHQNRNTAAREIAAGRTGPAPHFELPRLDTKGDLSLASLRGKAVVINFWASWCVPCKEEMPQLQRTWERYRNRGLVVLGVDAEDLSSDARKLARRLAITYPIVRDGTHEVVDAYGLTGYPETFFVDRRGRLVGEHIEGAIDLPANRRKLQRGISLALKPV
jgi:cytochrome c biogenesis protein CcmG, thiol:disulfide interchange protein DsbE